eukprot:14687246-Alexandrium_andersonii.AAC.1
MVRPATRNQSDASNIVAFTNVPILVTARSIAGYVTVGTLQQCCGLRLRARSRHVAPGRGQQAR